MSFSLNQVPGEMKIKWNWCVDAEVCTQVRTYILWFTSQGLLSSHSITLDSAPLLLYPLGAGEDSAESLERPIVGSVVRRILLPALLNIALLTVLVSGSLEAWLLGTNTHMDTHTLIHVYWKRAVWVHKVKTLDLSLLIGHNLIWQTAVELWSIVDTMLVKEFLWTWTSWEHPVRRKHTHIHTHARTRVQIFIPSYRFCTILVQNIYTIYTYIPYI